MTDPGDTLSLALRLHEAGDLQRAEVLYRQILQSDPQHPDALRYLGMIALAVDRCEIAVDCIRQALRVRPDLVDSYGDLGNALVRLGRVDEAVDGYLQALAQFPEAPILHGNLGLIRLQQGRLDEAVVHCRQALLLDAGFFQAHNNLGLALVQQGNIEEAVDSYRRAIALRPDIPDLHVNLGNALQALDRLDEAAESIGRALELRPDLADAHNNLGNLLRRRHRWEEATACFRRAIELRPDFPASHANLGSVLKEQGELDEAIACCRRAVELDPKFAGAHSSLVYNVVFHPDYDSAALLAEAREWNRRHAEPLAATWRPHDNEPDPERRLRVGYVSADFRQHAIAHILLPLLAHHDRSRTVVCCYSGVASPDAVTERLRACADVWHSTVGLTDERLAERIRSDGIDILVDLNQHMAGTRLLTFARRPAPVQVTWLGYPGTTGVSAIGYRFTDPYLDPPGETDGDYAERSVRLPRTYWCYDPLADDPPEVGELPALAGAPITFGCLNNFCKVNAETLELWAGVLRAAPDSRLLLLAPTGAARARVAARLESQGVAADRVAFVDRQPRLDYLRTYQRVDLALDPLPYNGHNTALDAAWMGVPTVTLAGRTVVGRAGLSILHNLGLPELAARSAEEFVTIASELARDLPRLSGIRAELRARMEASPLMNGPEFARDVETAYRAMWREWCLGTSR